MIRSRVAELEQENARLHAIAQRRSSHAQDQPADELLSEVEQLRAQLAAAQLRERELSEELTKKASSQQSRVKTEAVEPELSLPNRNGSMQLPHKSGASLGLMVGALLGVYTLSGPIRLTWSHGPRHQVLLCALPSLLSLPAHSTMPTTCSIPMPNGSNAISASSFDVPSFVPGEFDWLNSMDIDIDSQGRVTTGAAMPAASAHHPHPHHHPHALRKLEFVDPNAEALGLSGLDISFDATPSQDGKIRVRIHPPSSSSASSSSEGVDGDDQSMGGSESVDQLGPFLGIGADYGMSSVDAGIVLSPASGSYPLQAAGFDLGYGSDFGVASGSSSSSIGGSSSSIAAGGRRRVRIALKSLPGEGREGGEWEVQVC